jgi:p-hydroxybenzoate 3-monooxygenase
LNAKELSMSSTSSSTTVGIVGAGPAGLMLSHLLHLEGIESMVIDTRSRVEIEQTVRAGILERDSVRLLVDSGVSVRVLEEGHEHGGIELAFGGDSHRIDFNDLVGADITSARPGMRFTDAGGVAQEVRCDYLVGTDGSRSMCRQAIPEDERRSFFREYPFAWFGILCDAPPSAPELIHNHSDRGFAMISQRTESMQRTYFQCDPDENVDHWSEDQIWDELQTRVGTNGYSLKEGPITSKTVLRFRSFVCEPMRHGNLLLAGDASHTVPPTGAKGLNLALADVRVLAENLEQATRSPTTTR